MILRALLFSILLAGCVPLPPTPQDLQAKQFMIVPEKAVIYLVRDYPDHNHLPATVWLGESSTVTTHPGTYYRWEVEPGRHRIAGFAVDNGSITLQVDAGKLYFVQQSLRPWISYPMSYFQLVPEPQGRSIVMRGVMVGG
jgi:hypothetical protein